MKKLILIAFSLVSLNFSAQLPSGTVSIVNVNPYQVCCDDTITINFTFKFSGNPDTMAKWIFNLNQDPFIYWPIWGPKPFTAFYSLPKQLVGSDTVYSAKAVVPCEFVDIFTGGLTRVRVSNESLFLIYIEDCRVGIEEYWLNPNIHSVYYDTMGNIITPRSNQLMIQRSGNRTRKVIVHERQ